MIEGRLAKLVRQIDRSSNRQGRSNIRCLKKCLKVLTIYDCICVFFDSISFVGSMVPHFIWLNAVRNRST